MERWNLILPGAHPGLSCPCASLAFLPTHGTFQNWFLPNFLSPYSSYWMIQINFKEHEKLFIFIQKRFKIILPTVHDSEETGSSFISFECTGIEWKTFLSCCRLLVGAPEAQTRQPGVVRGGAVFRCDTTVNDRCQPVPFDSTGGSSRGIQNSNIKKKNKKGITFYSLTTVSPKAYIKDKTATLLKLETLHVHLSPLVRVHIVSKTIQQVQYQIVGDLKSYGCF